MIAASRHNLAVGLGPHQWECVGRLYELRTLERALSNKLIQPLPPPSLTGSQGRQDPGPVVWAAVSRPRLSVLLVLSAEPGDWRLRSGVLPSPDQLIDLVALPEKRHFSFVFLVCKSLRSFTCARVAGMGGWQTKQVGGTGLDRKTASCT